MPGNSERCQGRSAQGCRAAVSDERWFYEIGSCRIYIPLPFFRWRWCSACPSRLSCAPFISFWATLALSLDSLFYCFTSIQLQKMPIDASIIYISHHKSIAMKAAPLPPLTSLLFIMLIASVSSLYTTDMARKRGTTKLPKANLALDISTSCNILDFSAVYNYTGIVASGYLSVGTKGNSALAYTFYGKKDVKTASELKNYPTVLWLNGGPGSSSQLGNLQEIGPLLLVRQNFKVQMIQNNFTWANNYNLLFIDQPVGTGLSYADLTAGNPFAKTLDQVADDFYRSLYQLYNGKGCFSPLYFGIPPSSPLVLFGQSYGGKYVPAIAKKILQAKQAGGFLTGLKGIAIGDGFTQPYQILSEVGTYSYHLGLIDMQQRMKLQKILLNASRHHLNSQWDQLHDDFDNALEYVVGQSGVNIYDITKDGDYPQLLQPYFRNIDTVNLYKFNPEVIYDSYPEQIYMNMWTDFMKPEVTRVQYLLNKKLPVLIYNGQNDLIVQTPGTMKWVDRLYHSSAEEFRRKLFSAWAIKGRVVGGYKEAGFLELRIVFNAGHLVPMDRGEEALDMATSFVNRVTR